MDIINQDFILPNIKNIAKLSADFKQGDELVYVSGDNNQETILVNDEVRQADYKYTYSDRNMINDKSMMADLVIQNATNFSQVLPLDMAEIFTWYFEQKGVENPERFLNQEQLQFMKQTEKMQMAMQSSQAMAQAIQMLKPAMTGQATFPEQAQTQEDTNPEERSKAQRLLKKKATI